MLERWYGIDPAAPRPLSAEAYQGHLDNIAKGENGRMIFNCPHCGTSAVVRTSRKLSPLLREAYYQCRNLVCGHTFKVMLEAVETVSPASMPRPDIAAQLEKGRNAEAGMPHGNAKATAFATPPTDRQRRRMADLERRELEKERARRYRTTTGL